MILAGGYATRLRPLSYALPKLLFPVCGKPILERTIEHLSAFGVGEVILAVNYMADQLREYFGERYQDVTIRYSLEPKPLGTGGPIAYARRYYDTSEPLLAMNGDILSEVDVNAMRRLHQSTKALTTIALHEVENPTRFGVARLDEHSKIREFVEKPKAAEAPSRMINAGVYLIEPEVVDRIPQGRRVVIEREIFPALASEGRLFGYVHSGAWFDIGNITDFRNANFALLQSKSRGRVVEAKGAEIARSAKLTRPAFVCDDAVVEEDVKLGAQTIVGRRARIHRNASLAGTIVFDDAEVGEGCVIEGAIVGNDVSIGKRVTIQPGSVIAGHAKIHDSIRITRDVYVHPFKEIDQDIIRPGHVV